MKKPEQQKPMKKDTQAQPAVKAAETAKTPVQGSSPRKEPTPQATKR